MRARILRYGVANALGIELEHLEVEVKGQVEVRGTMLVDRAYKRRSTRCDRYDVGTAVFQAPWEDIGPSQSATAAAS